MGIIGNSTKYQKKSSLRRAVFCFFGQLSLLELNVDISQIINSKISIKKRGCLILNLRHPQPGDGWVQKITQGFNLGLRQ
jgi:hypothetical protein